MVRCREGEKLEEPLPDLGFGVGVGSGEKGRPSIGCRSRFCHGFPLVDLPADFSQGREDGGWRRGQGKVDLEFGLQAERAQGIPECFAHAA